MLRVLLPLGLASVLLASGCLGTTRRASVAAAPQAQPSKQEAAQRHREAEKLIDRLQELDSVTVGLHPTAMASAFLADSSEPRFVMGVLGSERPDANAVMRELVEMGVDALPVLLAHLEDARPTQLVVGGQFPIMWKQFAEEYDPRTSETDDDSSEWREFRDHYVVKVGDVCFVLVGQIVNRELLAVRYEPTGGMIVNSPIESPILAERARGDWGALTRQQHLESLIAELDGAEYAHEGMPAILRLQCYYPDDLQRLREGRLQAKIAEFEAEWREEDP